MGLSLALCFCCIVVFYVGQTTVQFRKKGKMGIKRRLFEVESNVDYLPLKAVEKGVKNPAIKDYAYTLHDKDINEDGSLKPAHYHIMMRLKHVYDSKYVCQWFGLGEQCVEKVKGRWSDALKYLIHENALDKFQYNINEVKTNFNFEEEKNIDSKVRLNEISEKIISGEIRRWNYLDCIKVSELQKWDRKIQIAFKYFDDSFNRGGDRQMDVVFIQGEPGIGKTTFAKEYAKKHCNSYFVSSGSNDPFDGYKSEDAVILDDVKPNDFRISDLLKITDNHTASTVKSRYFNKRLYCELMIITSVVDIHTFYNQTENREIGLEQQLMRRCQRMFVMKEHCFELYYYDKKKKRHILRQTVKGNPIAEKVKLQKRKTIDQQLQEDLSFFKSILSKDEVQDDN